MPIKVRVIDNESQIKVRPKSDDEIHVKSGCDITGKILLEKIEELKRTKQDLGFVPLDGYLISSGVEGVIPSEDLLLLTSYLVDKVALRKNIYYLTDVDKMRDILTYICTDLEVSLNKIEVFPERQTFIVSKSQLDHASLSNLDYLHSGHTGFAGIEFGTTAEWDFKSTYIPPRGMLVVYTDYAVDETTGTLIPAFKIGDGASYLINQPFAGDDIREAFEAHLKDNVRHITSEERARWNNKLNYVDPGEGDLLEFTRN